MRTAPTIFIYLLLIITFFFFSCTTKKKETVVQSKEKISSTELLKLISIADEFYDTAKHDSAFHFYNKAKIIATSEQNHKKLVYCIFSLADIQRTKGDYIGSEATCTEAIPHLSKIKNPNYAWNVYIILGDNFLRKYNYTSALYYFNKAYNLKIDQLRKLKTQNNIALVYNEQGRYKASIKIYEYLITQKEIKKDLKMYARTLENLGICYEQIDSKLAFQYYKRALSIQKKIGNEWGLIGSYINLSQHYQSTKPVLAKEYATKAYNLATKWNATNDRLNALIELVHSSDGSDLKKYSLKYIALKDRLTKAQQISKNQFAKIKYDSRSTILENETLKNQKIETDLELEREKYKNLLSYVLIGFVILLSLGTFYYLTIRNQNEKTKVIYQSEVRIAKKLHDELANEVYQTINLVESKNLALKENKNHLLDSLEIIYNHTRNLSRENGIIITDESYSDHLRYMLNSYNLENLTVTINGYDEIEWDSVTKQQKINIYRILQELLVNMKKHSKATLVHLYFITRLNEIQIDYSDNGNGINSSNIHLKNGLQNIENRIKSIKGTISFKSVLDKGFRVNIKFPIK